jgi:hypothetical protein
MLSKPATAVYRPWMLFLALASLFFLVACRQVEPPPDTSPTPTRLPAAAPTLAPPTAAAPPTPEPTPIPVPTPWPTAAYDPELADWTVLVYGRAEQQAVWQTAPITGSIQLVTAVAEDDPAALGRWLAESRANRPANRYALLMLDSSHPPELDEPLPPLDLLLFNQPQTAALDLLLSWQPYGRLALGSPAFAAGWLTPDRLGRLTAALPQGEAADWLAWLVADYTDNHPAPAFLDWQPLTAVDLQLLPALMIQLPALNTGLRPALPAVNPPLAMRSTAAATYDLGQWAAAMGAEELAAAISEVVRHSTGSQFGWQLTFNPALLTAPPLVNGWQRHNVPLDSQQPASMILELAGVGLADFRAQIGRYEADGRWRLIHHQAIVPATGRWADGVRQLPWVWYPLTPYLSDGESAGHLPLWPVADGRLAAVGQYIPASGAAQAGWLLLSPDQAGLAPEVWLLPDEPASWRAIIPQPGDGFAVYNLYLDANGNLQAETGGLLDLRSATGLDLTDAPLPAGDYAFRFLAANLDGQTADALLSWQAADSPRWPGHTMFLELEYGFQFAYPEQWPSLRRQDNQWRGQDQQQTTDFTISRLTEWRGATLLDLKEHALAVFGDVERLLEETAQVNGQEALLTAYGYTAPDGPRTGLLLAFRHNGVGYLVDIDGPLTAEPENLALARTVAASWSFLLPPSAWSNSWERLSGAPFTAYQPVTYRHQPLENGWHLLRSPSSPAFIALRQDAGQGRDPMETVRHWLAIASRDVANFATKETVTLPLSGQLWTSIDFSYTQSNGQPVYGFLMTTEVDGQEWVAWAETPAAEFDVLVNDLFLTIVAAMGGN